MTKKDMKIDMSLMGIVYVAMAYPNPITFKFSILLIVMLAFEARETISFHKVTIAII